MVSARGETSVLPGATPAHWALTGIQELDELDPSDANSIHQATQNNGQMPAKVVNNLKSERGAQPPKTIFSFVYHQ